MYDSLEYQIRTIVTIVMRKILLLISYCIYSLVLDAQSYVEIAQSVFPSPVKNTNGVAVADYDQDGDLDIFFTGIKNFDLLDKDTWSRLFRNEGDGHFVETTEEAGFGIQYVNEGLKAARGEKMGASWGDYDNDGYPDLFLANSRENQLYHNNKDGTFTDVTGVAGVAGCNTCYSSTGLWWDHDRDGDLDLLVSNLNTRNVMYENKGDGTFQDVTELTGLGGGPTITWSSVAIDAGKDGFLDLLQVNDTQAKEFFENRTGQRYNEAALAYRLDNKGAGMGVAVGDCNNDGLFDLYITNIFNHLPNPLFVDSGNRRYTDKAAQFGVQNTGWGWGVSFLDADHDGDEDLVAVNGPIDKLYDVVQPDEPNVFFQNRLMDEGEPGFRTVSSEVGFDGFAKGKGLEVFDYDQDGDLDLVVANMEDAAYFYKSETMMMGQEKRNWIQIKLQGVESNRDGFGTTVQCRVGNQWYHRYHHGAAVFGQSIKPVHFGLSKADTIDEIRFIWPSGRAEAIFRVPSNQLLAFREGGGILIENIPGGNSGGFSFTKHSVSPNPTSSSSTLTFRVGKNGALAFRVFSSLGIEVFKTTSFPDVNGNVLIEWVPGSIPFGTYYYIATWGEQVFSGSIIYR